MNPGEETIESVSMREDDEVETIEDKGTDEETMEINKISNELLDLRKIRRCGHCRRMQYGHPIPYGTDKCIMDRINDDEKLKNDDKIKIEMRKKKRGQQSIRRNYEIDRKQTEKKIDEKNDEDKIKKENDEMKIMLKEKRKEREKLEKDEKKRKIEELEEKNRTMKKELEEEERKTAVLLGGAKKRTEGRGNERFTKEKEVFQRIPNKSKSLSQARKKSPYNDKCHRRR